MNNFVGEKATQRGSLLAGVNNVDVPDQQDFNSSATGGGYALPKGQLSPRDGVSPSEEARIAQAWGPRFMPDIEQRKAREQFSLICQRIKCELDDLALSDGFVNGRVMDHAAGVIVEIAQLLEALFDCPFGEGESLKAVVVTIQSQTNNVKWSQETVAFLKDVASFLRARYVINDQTVDEVYKIMQEHGLDPFRGSISDRDIRTRYHLVEVAQE